MQTRSNDENSVCPSVRPSIRPSVCLSVKRVHCDKIEEKAIQIFIPCERPFTIVFWEEEWLVGGDPFYLKFWVNRPRWSEIADFEPIFAHSASAVTVSEKSSGCEHGCLSTLPVFTWMLTPERWHTYVLSSVEADVLQITDGDVVFTVIVITDGAAAFFMWL